MSKGNFISLKTHWKTILLVLVCLELAGVIYFHFLLGYSFVDAAAVSVFGNTCLLISLLFTSYLLSVYQPTKGVKLYLISLCVILGLTSAFLAREALDFWDDILQKPLEMKLTFLTYTIPVNIAMHVMFGVFSVLLSNTSEKRNVDHRMESIQALTRDAELNKLQQQLQPHFLFNSLNSINALILNRPDEAREMVQKLSDFLRATLKRSNQQGVVLGEELDYLQLYLDIEKVRFGHRLDIRFFVSDEVKGSIIPCLILQPIVENAIKFGLYGTTGNVVVVFNAKLFDNHLMVEISNPFDAEMQPSSGTGFGLKGIARRLYLLYARNDLLETSVNGNLFVTRLKIPQ